MYSRFSHLISDHKKLLLKIIITCFILLLSIRLISTCIMRYKSKGILLVTERINGYESVVSYDNNASSILCSNASLVRNIAQDNSVYAVRALQLGDNTIVFIVSNLIDLQFFMTAPIPYYPNDNSYEYIGVDNHILHVCIRSIYDYNCVIYEVGENEVINCTPIKCSSYGGIHQLNIIYDKYFYINEFDSDEFGNGRGELYCAGLEEPIVSRADHYTVYDNTIYTSISNNPILSPYTGFHYMTEEEKYIYNIPSVFVDINHQISFSDGKLIFPSLNVSKFLSYICSVNSTVDRYIVYDIHNHSSFVFKAEHEYFDSYKYYCDSIPSYSYLQYYFDEIEDNLYKVTQKLSQS